MLEEWERLKDAVEQAAELEGAAADQLLQELLADDPELLAQARRVHASGTREDDFLEPSAPAPVGGAAALREGVRVGPFEIKEVLGHGGMGSVFLAEQDSPTRTVALKVLSSAMLSPTALARFRYEVQALASLRHRGIAQVYETGIHVIDDGPLLREMPWFAMEYVERGRTVVAYAREEALHRDARVELMAEVCDAVQHGHQKGVVHRDLKPDNILVNAEGHPKVIDFGVARATDREQLLTTMRTGVGEIVGTLPYMSPEQLLGGDAGGDVRSDVYALGVVLYEMLVGERPIDVDPKDFVTSARRICEEPPKRPGAVESALRGDLEAIMLKALEKDPARRYPSVNALAADLRRYLAHRPIEARPPSAIYQMRMFARRHRAVVGAIAAVVSISVAAAAVSIGFALRSNRAEKDAVEQKNAAVAERERVETLFDTILSRSFRSTLEIAPQVQELGGGKPIVSKLMAAVQKDLAVLEGLAEKDPRVQVQLAETYLRLGDLQGNNNFPNLGDVDAARKSYARAIELLQRALELAPAKPLGHATLVKARLRLALVMGVGRFKELAKRREDVAAILETAQALAREYPDSKSILRQLGDAERGASKVAMAAEDLAVAERHGREAVRIFESLGDTRRVMLTKYRLADIYFQAERHEEAMAELGDVIAHIEARPEADRSHFGARAHLAKLYSRYGESAHEAGDLEVAVGALERAARLFDALHAEDPEDRRIRVDLHITLTSLIAALGNRGNTAALPAADRLGHLDKAIGYAKRQIEILRATKSAFAASMAARVEATLDRLRRDREATRKE